MADQTTFYTNNAERLSAQYNAVPFEEVHKQWLEKIPEQGLALDVGAGSGRDARYLTAQGMRVVAVEPSQGMRENAQRYDTQHSIHWLADSLPDLSQVFSLQTKFDLILLSAVWMHIAPSNRQRSLRKLSSLLKPNGKLVISLRHGPSYDERLMHSVDASELAQLASQFGLTYTLLTESTESDLQKREDVDWQTVLLSLPDDGSGAFPLLRNIVINDKKSSTYKLALLRCLLRIAEGHPGAVLEQTDESVVLPIGLVALYWMKLYKPLLDKFEMQQSSNSRASLGFIQAQGWTALKGIVDNKDLYLGAIYTKPETALALYQTLKHISSLIRDMPANYITKPGSKDALFEVQLARTSKSNNGLVLDHQFLSSFGKISVPRHIWDSFTRFSVWIEPALLNEWIAVMAGYENNRAKGFGTADYLEALRWDSPDRSTTRVRKRIDELMLSSDVVCCWTGKLLKPQKDYAVDHAFPFARWPNNDLWNLLPSNNNVNAQKSDKLPTVSKLISSRSLIKHWWLQGWSDNENEFFTQTNFALPNLSPNNSSIDDVFEAFVMQRDRIKDFQQLPDWG